MSERLYNVPAKPRGLEAITITPKDLITLLEAEKKRQAQRASTLKKQHKDKVLEILSDATARVKAGKIPGRKRYDEWIIELPSPPVFSPCDYDSTIHRLKQDKRESLVVSASEWNRFFPCDLEQK